MATAGKTIDTHILAEGNAAYTVLLAELLTQWRLGIVRTCPYMMFVKVLIRS